MRSGARSVTAFSAASPLPTISRLGLAASFERVLDQAGDVVFVFDDEDPVFGHALRASGAITEDSERRTTEVSASLCGVARPSRRDLVVASSLRPGYRSRFRCVSKLLNVGTSSSIGAILRLASSSPRKEHRASVVRQGTLARRRFLRWRSSLPCASPPRLSSVRFPATRATFSKATGSRAGSRDGRYAERVYDHVVNGVGAVRGAPGPAARVRDLQGRPGRASRRTTRRTTCSSRSACRCEGSRAKQRWEIPSLNLAFTVDPRRRLAHRLRELVHPARADRQDVALNEFTRLSRRRRGPHRYTHRLYVGADDPPMRASIPPHEADDHRDRLRLQRSRASFPPASIPSWPRPGRPTTSSSSTTRAPTRRAPWRARCRACAWSTSRPRGWSWRARPRAAPRPATSSPTSTPTAACRCSGSSASSAASSASPALVAVTGPYRFYDWDWIGRALIRAYDLLVAPPTHALVHHVFGVGAILYGGNFAVRRDALARIGGFDRTIEFHGEDTNLGRRLTPLGSIAAGARLLGLDVGAPLPRDGQAQGVRPVRAQLLVRDPAPSSGGSRTHLT